MPNSTFLLSPASGCCRSRPRRTADLRVVEKHPPVPAGAVRLLLRREASERRASIHPVTNRHPIGAECVCGIQRSPRHILQVGHRTKRLAAVARLKHAIRRLIFLRLSDGEDLAVGAVRNREHSQYLLRGGHSGGSPPVGLTARVGDEQPALGAGTQGIVVGGIVAAGRQPEDEQLLRLVAGDVGRRSRHLLPRVPGVRAAPHAPGRHVVVPVRGHHRGDRQLVGQVVVVARGFRRQGVEDPGPLATGQHQNHGRGERPSRHRRRAPPAPAAPHRLRDPHPLKVIHRGGGGREKVAEQVRVAVPLTPPRLPGEPVLGGDPERPVRRGPPQKGSSPAAA